MAYATKYRIEFEDFDGNHCEIDFQYDNYVGDILELTGSGTPATITYQPEDFVYAPTRFAGATITVVVNGFLADLYASGYQDVRVLVLKDNQFIYCGFLTPEIYSQSNNGGMTKLTLESISALASLQYIPYVPPADAYTQTLHSLIRDALIAAKGTYTSVWFPENWDATAESMFVSTANFIDEEEKPVSYREVLEYICTFYGMTITEKKNTVCFVDVDYIKAGHRAYVRYDGYMNNPEIIEYSTDVQPISDNESKGSDNVMSLLPAYNKVTVIASDYQAKQEELFMPFDGFDRGIVNESLDAEKTFTDEDDNVFEYRNRYYRDSNYYTGKFVYVNGDFMPWADSDNASLDYAGANLFLSSGIPTANLPKSLSWSDCLRIKPTNPEGTVWMNDRTKFNPDQFLIFYYQSKKAFSFLKGGYIAINFSLFLNDIDEFPITGRESSLLDLNPNSPIASVPMSLKCGNQWYNAALKSWFEYYSFFLVNIYSGDNREQYYNGQWRACSDDFNYTFGTKNLTGYAVSVPADMIGELTLYMYCPQTFVSRYGLGYLFWEKYIFIKDLEINYEANNFNSVSGGGYDDTDTTYSNEINSEAVSEYPDITFNLTSKNRTGCSKSKVYDNFVMIDTIMTETHGEVKPEVLAVSRITGQYSRPTYKLQEVTVPKLDPLRPVQMMYLPDKKFLLAGEEIDVQMNRSKVTLLEIV